MAKELWEIKYRPKSIDDYVFNDEKQEKIIRKFIEEKTIPHLLLVGHRGTGKTSLAFVIKNEFEISDSDFMIINASDENNVDTMRNKIKGFISTYSMSDFKVVLLDEADYLSHSAQALLRNMMEEYSDNARFILSCNKGNKIIPEIKSRCFELIFKTINKDQMLERLANILANEGAKCKVSILKEYVNLSHPDMRKAIQLLQNNVVDGKIESPSVVDSNTEVNIKIVELMENDRYLEIKDLLSEEGFGDDDWIQLYKFLYTYLNEIGKFKDEKNWKIGILTIAEYLYKHSIVADPEINATAMFIKLGEI